MNGGANFLGGVLNVNVMCRETYLLTNLVHGSCRAMLISEHLVLVCCVHEDTVSGDKIFGSSSDDVAHTV